MKERTILHEEMKRDLIAVYRKILNDHRCRDNTEAFNMVVRHPAPRFYIDVRSAHVILSPMMHGDRSRLERMKPLKREMYEDLFDVVVRLSRKEHFIGSSLHYLLRFAVTQPAPRFYIKLRRMEQIWKEYSRESRERRINRLCRRDGKVKL